MRPCEPVVKRSKIRNSTVPKSSTVQSAAAPSVIVNENVFCGRYQPLNSVSSTKTIPTAKFNSSTPADFRIRLHLINTFRSSECFMLHICMQD